VKREKRKERLFFYADIAVMHRFVFTSPYNCTRN
jgi:hypothetical protein